MWENTNELPEIQIREKEFVLLRFGCGLCGYTNEFCFHDFKTSLFLRRSDVVRLFNFKCKGCGSTNYHDIEISIKEGTFVFDVSSEEPQTDEFLVDQDTVYVSTHVDDISSETLKVPMELDLVESIIGNPKIETYRHSVDEIRRVINSETTKEDQFILMLMFSNSITILETYLFDLTIESIHKDPKYLKRIIEDFEIFEKRKIEMKEVYKLSTKLRDVVIEEIHKLIFHNLVRVKKLVQKVFLVDITDLIGDLPASIHLRHDVVHRNGKHKNGEYHIFSTGQIEQLIDTCTQIVEYVENNKN